MPKFSRKGVLKGVAGFSLLLAVASIIAVSDTLHAFVYGLIVDIEPLVVAHPVLGASLFSLLAATSAMLAFFSSAVLVPVAVQAWGQPITLLLLWVGWFAGGAAGYAVGRWLGLPVVRALAGAERVTRYQATLTRHAPFPVVLLLQLALPSEVPGYLLGTLKYPFARFALALAIAELPYAIGTVYLSEFFLRRETLLLLGLGFLGIGLAGWSYYYLHRLLPQTADIDNSGVRKARKNDQRLS